MDSTTSGLSDAQTQAFFGAFILGYAVVILVVMALAIWLFWRIFTKAGMSGPLALLNIIPGFGFWICLFLLAFSTWPNEARPAAMPNTFHPPQPPTDPNIGGPPMTT